MSRSRPWVVALYLSPWIVGFAVFIAYPLVSSLYFSFTRYDLLSQPTWAGLANYRFMLTKDPFFWLSIRNTLWIVVVGVPLRIVVAVATASLLVRPRRGVKVYRTLYFLPSMAPPVAAALAFLFLFNPATGPINQLLGRLGMRSAPLWFYSPGAAKWGLVILSIWGVGDALIIFLAGMLDVPRQLYEAADIEGANRWQRFRFVTLPAITPVVFFSLVIGVIDGFQYFTQAYVTSITASGDPTGGGLGYPQGSLLFYSVYLYQQGFTSFRMGYASALAWVLFLITMVCTLVLIKTSNRWVHYQGGGMFR